MKQLTRRLKDGQLELVDVPEPLPGRLQVAVRVEASVISAGTERATLEIARGGLVAKARARPDQARQVIDRARREGLRSTWALVRSRLEELGPLGYSAAGTVVAVGEDVVDLKPGERVAIAGAGAANHAELDVVPALQCARVPESVDAASAAFATVGAIAMQGFRRADVQVGARVCIIGLGLVGQLSARIARAAGCEVLGIDLRDELIELAELAGAEGRRREEIEDEHLLEGGFDAVMICAAAETADPVELAAHLARDRAPVVVVGDVRLEVPRKPFYDKELELRLSRSYGPGRYDPAYEVHGRDYPIGYVRWTQQRNMESFLKLVESGKVKPEELITHRFPFHEAEQGFELLSSSKSLVGVLLEYDEEEPERPGPSASQAVKPRPPRTASERPCFGLIGAGNFATSTIIPGLKRAGFEPRVVSSAGGLSAESARRRFGFDSVARDASGVIEDEGLDLVVVATQHDLHAQLAASALAAGRDVYVEKPLALDSEGLETILAAQRSSDAALIVGFNRRYAPGAVACRALRGPRLMSFRVNAGLLPADHWLDDPQRGGGRLLGEGCHFIDFLCDQAGCDPHSVMASGYPSRSTGSSLQALDNFSVRIEFADGSVGTVNYSSAGAEGPGKERFEVSATGAHAVIDDFRRTSTWVGRRRRRIRGRGQDKGFSAQYDLVRDVVERRVSPPTIESYAISTMTTLAAVRSLQLGAPQAVFSAP